MICHILKCAAFKQSKCFDLGLCKCHPATGISSQQSSDVSCASIECVTCDEGAATHCSACMGCFRTDLNMRPWASNRLNV